MVSTRRFLLDRLWDDERTNREQHDHRGADHEQPHQVSGEVRHAVQRDGGVARLDDHAASRSPHDLVAGSQRHLHRPHRGLVSAHAGLRDRADRSRCRSRAGRTHRAASGYADRLPVPPSLLAALATHRGGKSSFFPRQAGGRGSCCGNVGCDVGRFAACLLLGRGTQPNKTWATTCCVPGAFIPLYMGSVKPLHVFCRPHTSVVRSAYSSSLIRSSSSPGSSMRTRRSQPEPYGSVLTTSGFSSASALTSMTSPLIGASIGEDASSDSTCPMRRLACRTSPRSGSARDVISPI